MPDGLARAREELRKAQYNLAHYRRMGAPFSEIFSRLATDRVLAALSWVWDEQERARAALLADVYQDIKGLYDEAVAGRFAISTMSPSD